MIIIILIAAILFAGNAVPPKPSMQVLPPVQEIIETIPVKEMPNDQLDKPNDVIEWSDEDIQSITALAKMAVGEYGLCETPEQKLQCAAVIECAMWRVMAGESRGFCNTPLAVVSQPYQFHGYDPSNYVSDELFSFVSEVYAKAYRVLQGEDAQEVGCVLPPSYLWFYGTGTVNVFRDAYEGGNVWDWSWGNPYA